MKREKFNQAVKRTKEASSGGVVFSFVRSFVWSEKNLPFLHVSSFRLVYCPADDHNDHVTLTISVPVTTAEASAVTGLCVSISIRNGAPVGSQASVIAFNCNVRFD